MTEPTLQSSAIDEILYSFSNMSISNSDFSKQDWTTEGTFKFVQTMKSQVRKKLFLEYRAVAEALDIGVWKYDLNTLQLDWDTGVYKRYGVTTDMFPTPVDFWRKCLTKESLTKSQHELRLAVAGEKDYATIYDIQLPSGDMRQVLVRAIVDRDSNNQPRYLYGINLDVTEQQKVKQENIELLAQLQEAQAIAKIGSWSFDIFNRELTWSPELFHIYELPEQVSKNELYELYRSRIHPDDQALLDQTIEKAIATGADYVVDYRLAFTNGRIKYVQGIGKVSGDQNGKSVRLSGTCRDQTKEIELQKMLESERTKAIHSAKLSSLGEMSAGIAHEINNPLAIIEGNLEMLSKYINNPQKLTAKIESMQNACKRINKIVNGLKKFSRSGDSAIFEPHSLSSILREALILVGVKAKSFNTNISSEVDTEAKISCDSLQIEQVLINLISNAIDAVKDRSERWVKISIFEDGKFVVLQITDSGSGLTSEVKDKIFNPFFTTKKIGEGTGLGLSISKGILDDHHASISLDETCQNTCFEVRFYKIENSDAP